jgi:hypothetical protein
MSHEGVVSPDFESDGVLKARLHLPECGNCGTHL